jgi:hypothetical protein
MTEHAPSSFPHEPLTALSSEQPNNLTLKLLHQELNANAISVPSIRGNGSLGHLALTVSAAAYTLAAGNNVQFIPLSTQAPNPFMVQTQRAHKSPRTTGSSLPASRNLKSTNPSQPASKNKFSWLSRPLISTNSAMTFLATPTSPS